jgi:hypothetical protein
MDGSGAVRPTLGSEKQRNVFISSVWFLFELGSIFSAFSHGRDKVIDSTGVR